MKIVTLVDNISTDSRLKQKHGLCFYIETAKHKVLFDVGSDDTFLQNAKVLGIDISAVDMVVISHGHIDHGGGLAAFLRNNNHAKIYIQKRALEPHFAKVLFLKIPVGLTKPAQLVDRIIEVEQRLQIDDEMLLFADVEGQFETKSNRALLKEDKERDDFAHEQNLLSTQSDKAVLFSGCSHRGILNIYQRALGYKKEIMAVVGGFHLYNPISKQGEPRGLIREVVCRLQAAEATFYTCHCTGAKAYKQMKEWMGERLEYMQTGRSTVL